MPGRHLISVFLIGTTMNPLETLVLDCPWCATPIEISIDTSAGSQCYVEDCQQCCAPIVVTVRIDDSDDPWPQVTLEREGE